MELYINNQYIEYGDTVNIPITYQIDDIMNPGTIKTDVSKTISIPSTKNNDNVLSHLYRVDRVNLIDFNVSSKIPFQLRHNNEIFKSGYVKFGNITIDKTGNKSYEVNLFSKEAEFFKVLADTKLVDVINEMNLNHNISQSFLNTNWQASPTGIHSKLRYIPMMNGLYKDFKNDTYLNASNVKTGIGYNMDEWTIKSFRSYKQRPGIKFSSIFEQIKTHFNDYVYEDSDITTSLGDYYTKAVIGFNLLGQSKDAFENKTSTIKQWVTNQNCITEDWNLLDTSETPTIDELGLYSGDGYVPIHSVEGNIGLKGKLTYNVKFTPYWITVQNIPPAWDSQNVWLECGSRTIRVAFETNTLFNNYTTFAHAYTGYIYCPAGSGDRTTCYLVDSIGSTTRSTYLQNAIYTDENAIIKTYGDTYVSKFKVLYNDTDLTKFYNSSGTYLDSIQNPVYSVQYISTAGNKQYVETTFLLSKKDIHSHTLVTPYDFVPTDLTCKDFLLEYCRAFGIYIQVDVDNNILFKQRHNYYQNTTEDWSSKLDYSKDILINPLVFDKRRLIFGWKENTSNNYFKEYKEQIGYSYGDKVVNTGYDFTDDKLRVFDKTVFNPIQMVTNQINLTDPMGAIEYVTIPTSINVSKSGVDREQVDNSMFILFENGRFSYANNTTLMISDDTEDMISAGEYYHNLYNGIVVNPFSLPLFTTKLSDKSLDFGKPAIIWNNETDATYTDSMTIFNKFWDKYIYDRYNIDTKIMIAFFNLTNVDMNKFKPNKFIYVNGVNWVINRIVDYNPNNNNSTQVELISVQDKNNYLTL